MTALPDDDEIEAEGLHAMRVPAELVEHELASKSKKRRSLEILVSVGVTIVIFAFAIPAIVGSNYTEIFNEFRQLKIGQVAELFAIWTVVMVIYTGVLTAALPGLKRSQALTVNLGGSAVSNVVPFGGAAGVGATYAMTMSWGFDAPAVTLSVLVSGIWNVFAKLGIPILALLLLAMKGESTAKLVLPTVIGLIALVGGLVLFFLIVRSEALAERIGRIAERLVSRVAGWIRRPPLTGLPEKVLEFRHRSIGLIRARWRSLTIWMVLYNLGQFVLLLTCVRVLGASTDELGWIKVFAGFAFANLLTTIAITPSGVGFVEAGTVAALIAFGGDASASAAAVFLFRGFTYLLEIPLGALAWAVWAGHTRWRKPVGSVDSRALY
jgi:uncharacterized membrane protein YbhN (UPF0104 family)